MNFSIPKESFSHLLSLTNSVVERRNTMPVLANVKITAKDDKITLAATDLEVSLTGEAEAKVKEGGTITVDAKVLYEIVRELPNENVTVNLSNGQRLEVECGASRFKINGISSEEFPTIIGTTLHNPTTVEANKLFEMLDKTAFAVSTDETRYNINGVYVSPADATPLSSGSDSQNNYLRFVATDGHRLAMIDRPSDGFELSESVIIPRKGIQEIKKVLEDNDGAAQVAVHEGFFTVQSGAVTVGARLVEGQFPDYRQVIPLELKTKVEFDRKAVLSALKRVSLVTTDKTKAIKLKLIDGNLLISSSSPEYGEASETVEVSQDGEDVTVGFSGRYIIDLLSAMPSSEQVVMKLNGELGPGVFCGAEDPLYTCIVMPMRFE